MTVGTDIASGPGQTTAAKSLSVVFATDAPAVPTKLPSAGADPGQNLSLSSTIAFQFASAPAATGWIVFSADPGNTAQVHIARANTLTSGTTGTGVALQAGDVIYLPGANANEYWARTSTATQNVHALAL
jgi:hypothetical protein